MIAVYPNETHDYAQAARHDRRIHIYVYLRICESKFRHK